MRTIDIMLPMITIWLEMGSGCVHQATPLPPVIGRREEAHVPGYPKGCCARATIIYNQLPNIVRIRYYYPRFIPGEVVRGPTFGEHETLREPLERLPPPIGNPPSGAPPPRTPLAARPSITILPLPAASQ